MEDLLTRDWMELLGRVGGPLAFRLVLQPSMAAALAIRAGLKDARDGRPPFGRAIVSDPARRLVHLRDGWKDVSRVFLLAVVLDVVYQVFVLRWIYPGQTLVVATTLAIIPYLLIRGPVTRIARRKRPELGSETPAETSDGALANPFDRPTQDVGVVVDGPAPD